MEHVYEEIASPIKQMRLEDDVCSLQPDSSYPQSSSTPKANHSCPSRTSSGTEDSHPGSCSSQHSNQGRPFGVLVPNNNNQRLVPKSKTKPLKVLQNQGQLKISAYMNFGLLTVHVVQGRHLSSKQRPLCDSFVKMSLIPDDSKRCRCKTDVRGETNNPLYDEKFSFELLEEDYHKRLYISVWNKDQSSSMCEFLGCMSFGVRHLLNPNKDITGWYYLLTEEIGRKKHLQVSSKQRSLQVKHQPVPPVNQDVWGMESLTITLERGKHGYGFSVVEESPVKVGRVDRASPAETAGLHPGDCIIKVNGQNVSRSQAGSVAKLVKNGGQHLIVEVQRLKQVSTETLDKTEVNKQPSMSAYDYLPMRELQNYQNYRTMQNYQNIDCNTYQNMHTRKLAEFPRVPVHQQDVRVTEYQNIGGLDYPINRVPDYQNKNYVAMRNTYDQHDGSDADYSDNDCKENEFSVDEGIYSLPSNLITSTPLPLLCNGYQTVQSTEKRRQEAIHRLLTVEMDFIDLMHAGIQRYSRPLRHCILSQLQHSALFQNVEKLVTISEYHVKQMQDNMNSSDTDTSTSVSSSDNGHQFVQHLCMIYQSKVNMICQAYDLYARGIAGANQSLAELRKNPEFVKFVKEPKLQSGQPSISAFIYRPVQHVNELYQTLKEIFLNTDNQSRDFQGLKHVVEVLQECVSGISNYSCVDQVLSLSSLTSSSASEGHKSRSSSSDSVSSHPSKVPVSCSMRSMDSEVMRIQDKLVFPPNVPVFQLCKEERHLIYAGELFKCEGNQWKKVHVMLFSDLLVETEHDRDGHLKVIHEPLNLKDLNGIEALRSHGTEFVLHFLLRDFATNQMRHAKLLFRAPNMEQKFTWKSLLEQKVTSAGGQLQHFSSMSDCSETGVLI
ncbi:regulator of G-protein signalling 3 [Mytilus galloprovincialis]|uniref:Regulator of G-protein signalling 3 n=1 Tax=Mytilus galloprovincialis TaxID=29158 RepID=A0A8B6BYV0_MYTGA|nr:regulator of G-protein signalling 3 [Mytilus galloprovincialis]